MATAKKAETLIDAVDEINEALWEDPIYQSYAMAIYDFEAVEGKMVIDDVLMAIMIRDYAQGHVHENSVYIDLQDCKLAHIMKLRNQIMRRYKLSRKQRKSQLGEPPSGEEENT